MFFLCSNESSQENLVATKVSPYRDMVETRVFVHWLRTGERAAVETLIDLVERKFNPYHDEDGRFTSPPGAMVSYGRTGPGPVAERHRPDAAIPTRSARRRDGAASARPNSSLNGFRSPLVRDAVSPTTTHADSHFELNKRQAHLDGLRKEAGRAPDPAVRADLDDFQRRLDADRRRLDARSAELNRHTNEILRAGLAPVDIGEGLVNIARSQAELRDYIAVAGAIPIAGVVGKVGKVAKSGATSTTREVTQLGGSYSVVRKLRGYHAHHMPANSASPLSRGRGPSVAMLPDDHVATIS